MGKLSDKYMVGSVRSILDEALSEGSKLSTAHAVPSPARLLRFGKRRHFALGLILVAIFLLLLSFVLPKDDLFLWAGYSGLLMLVGAWQWDKAKKELVVDPRSHTTAVHERPDFKLHSVDGDAP